MEFASVCGRCQLYGDGDRRGMKQRFFKWTAWAGKELADLLFPPTCPVCGQIVAPKEERVCGPCREKLSVVKQPICKRCGKEVSEESVEYCLDCTRHRRTFESGRALLNYNEAASRSMAAIKYKNRREYLDFYAAAMGRRFGRVVRGWKAEVLVPVPVHPSRRRARGFNQAEELAKRLSRQWGIPVDAELLVRDKKTMPQRDLNPSERLKNLQKAFRVNPARACAGLWNCVVLVDDIYTTGSTIEACSRALKEAGVKEVYFLAVCIGHGV